MKPVKIFCSALIVFLFTWGLHGLYVARDFLEELKSVETTLLASYRDDKAVDAYFTRCIQSNARGIDCAYSFVDKDFAGALTKSYYRVRIPKMLFQTFYLGNESKQVSIDYYNSLLATAVSNAELNKTVSEAIDEDYSMDGDLVFK